MDIIIKSLKPNLLDDFLYFFDKIGFSDNPGWASCYCHFYHFDGSNAKWAKRSAKENREASKKLILNGIMNGFIAYLEGKPVGWCNTNLKESFPKLKLNRTLNIPYDGKIASIVCFLISPNHRKEGIARNLLKYMISDFKKKKYDCIEAYPRKDSLSDANNYHGPFSIYFSEGFTIIKNYKTFYIVRKFL